MELLNGIIEGQNKNSADIIPVIVILALVLGFGKNTGFNLFNNSDARSGSSHHKHRRSSCESAGG